MRKLFNLLFIENWQRKLIALILAIIIWLLVNNSLITQKNYKNVRVRVANVPKGMAIQGLTSEGFLERRLSIKIEGHKKFLDDLSPDDIQVVLNAQGKDKTWVAIVNKNQIVFLNKLVNPYPYIRSISHKPFVISMDDQSALNNEAVSSSKK